MKQNLHRNKKHFVRTMSLWLLVLALILPVTGCGSSGSGLGGSSQTLDIDYVGGDGEVTEEEVAAKKESPLDWLKQKLSGDKKNAGVNGREDISKFSDDQSVQDLYSAVADTDTSDRESSHKSTDTDSTDETQKSEDTITLPDKKNNSDVDIPLPDNDKDNSGNKDNTNTKKHTVTFTIRCDTAVANGMAKDPKWAGIVPASGCILPVTTMEFEPGETVFDLLCRIRDTYKLQMEYRGSNGSQYVSGINNLYEFDGGRWSGWMYCVNDWYPNYYSGAYVVKDGDVIEWNYTCDLGCDLPNGDPNGYGKDWKDNHD